MFYLKLEIFALPHLSRDTDLVRSLSCTAVATFVHFEGIKHKML